MVLIHSCASYMMKNYRSAELAVPQHYSVACSDNKRLQQQDQENQLNQFKIVAQTCPLNEQNDERIATQR